MKNGKRRIRLRALLFAAAFLALVSAELLYSNLSLKVARFAVYSPKIVSPIRIVFLSDLHGREFGKANSRLLKAIEAEQPDIIVFGGDIIDGGADDDEIGRMCGLISNAANIAPVYFGMGNHESFFIEKQDASLSAKIAESGAELLEGSFVEEEINGSLLRIGGYAGHYRTPHMNTADPERQAADRRFFSDFEDTDRFKLLINHVPTNWLDWDYRDEYPVDLVLSGHYHGGIARIPLIERGVFAPYVGWFPPYTKGCFEGEKATCIISTGLAGAGGFPRFFNPPEIVSVELLPSGEEQTAP